MAYYSTKLKQPVTADIKKDFFVVASDLNHDGKVHYNIQIAKKGELTTTVLNPVPVNT